MIRATLLLLALTLQGDIQQIAGRVDAQVGVAALDLESGRSFSVHGGESFPMASVFKLPLAVEVLSRVDQGTLRLDQVFRLEPSDFSLGHSPIRDRAHGRAVTLSLREMILAAVSESDNTAGDTLLLMVTPAAVTRRMRTLGAEGIRVDRPEEEIISMFQKAGGAAAYARDRRDSATPQALVALLRAVHLRRDGLTPASHDLLVDALTRSSNPVRIGKRLPAGCVVAHKTGSMPGTLNDAGIITSPDRKRHFAIAIMTKASTTSSASEREEVVAAIARAVYEAWQP